MVGFLFQILVENQGRICFGPGIFDRKGITSNVTLSGHVLTDWNMLPFELGYNGNEVDTVADLLSRIKPSSVKYGRDIKRMAFWAGKFATPCNQEGRDTFIRLKGMHYINQ